MRTMAQQFFSGKEFPNQFSGGLALLRSIASVYEICHTGHTVGDIAMGTDLSHTYKYYGPHGPLISSLVILLY